jgi:SagB-type dehydrogenase family enzyme
LEAYVFAENVTSIAPGVYRYVAKDHELAPVAAGHLNEKLVSAALGQEWILTASAVFCIAAIFERTTAQYGHHGRRYVYLEAGHAAESLMLQAVSLGLCV